MNNCHVIYPYIPPVVKVRNWKSKQDVTDYYFVSSKLQQNVLDELDNIKNKKKYNKDIVEPLISNDIIKDISNSSDPVIVKESIYTDDLITSAVSKICIFIKREKTSIFPYVWSENNPLRFTIENNKWKQYNVNPFLNNDTPSEEGKVTYTEDSMLTTDILNIVFLEDYEKTYKNKTMKKYYFPNVKDTLKLTTNKKIYLNNNSILDRIWNHDDQYHKSMIENKYCVLSNARLKFKLSTDLSLQEIFNLLHSSNDIQFIQYVNDLNHIYYKVYKEHRIPEAYFDKWADDKLLNGEEQLVLYSFIKDISLLYAEIRIDTGYTVYINYKLDLSENVTYDIINKHSDKIITVLQKYIKNIKKPTITIENLSLRTSVQLPDSNLKSISKFFSSLLPIYNIPSKNRVKINIFDLYFKRVPKFGKTTDIIEYIKGKLSLDVSVLDILDDLQEYGLTENEVKDYLEEINLEKDIPALKKKKDIKNIGLIMRLSIIPFGIQINIDNASSFFDINNCLAWTRSSLLEWYKISVASKKLQETKAFIDFETEDKESEIIVSRQKDVKYEPGSESSLSDDDISYGGAFDKKYSRYFSNLLKKADPNIFSLTKDYARKCQVVDLRQPVAISKEQKEKIDNSEYKDSYDNAIEYGSDPDKTNIYMCPRVWCPKSHVPLSEKQYDNGNGKCPDKDEEPMLLYKHSTWYNDITRPHYVGFLKEKGYNNVKLPCCFKREQKVDSDKRESTYIMDRYDNIPKGRLGTIPESLHEFITPGVPLQLCKNSVKAKKCVLRYGIDNNKKDTFLNSITYLLNLDSKKELIKQIENILNPLMFISLENGLILQSFQSPKPLIIEEQHKQADNLYKWLSQYPDYCKLFDLKNVLDIIKDANKLNSNLTTRESMMISRQLVIMDAYTRFIDFLKEDSEKNPHMFFDILQYLGFLAIVWNRDSETLATVKCPYAHKLSHWIRGADEIVPSILLLQTNNSFEPLVIVDSKNKIKQNIYFTDYPKIEKLIKECPTFNTNDDIHIQNIYSLNVWTENIISNPSNFIINTIILDYNNNISALMTKANIWIDLPEPLLISSIKYLQASISIDKVLFIEDIEHNIYNIKIIKDDYTVWLTKLKEIGLGVQIGDVSAVSEIFIKSILKIPTIVYPDIPKVPVTLKNIFIDNIHTIEHDNSEWYSVKKYILKQLMQNYESNVKPLLKLSKRKKLEKLYKKFKEINQPARVAVLLEELPLHSFEELKKVYQELLLNKYYYDVNKIHDKDKYKEWVFSQHMLGTEDINFIKKPGINYNKSILPSSSEEIIEQKELVEEKLPLLLLAEDDKKISLPTKWKNKVWKDYDIRIPSNYTNNTLLDYIEWVLNNNFIKFDKNKLDIFLKKQYYDLLEDKNNYNKLLEEPSMFNAWNSVLGRQYRNKSELINTGLKDKSIQEIQEIWLKVYEEHRSNLWINDIDLYNISILFKISFFIISKTNMIKNNNELVSSVKFISSFKNNKWKTNPVIMLYKEKSGNKNHHVYGVIKKDNNYYYKYGKDLPSEILNLIEQFKLM